GLTGRGAGGDAMACRPNLGRRARFFNPSSRGRPRAPAGVAVRAPIRTLPVHRPTRDMNPRRHALTLAPAALAVALGGYVRLSSVADGALLAGVVAADKARGHGGAPPQ